MRPLIIFTLFPALALAVAGDAQLPDWTHAQPLTIALSNFKYTPSDVTLQRGTPYRLHLVNNAGGGHDFAAKQFFADSDIAPEDAGKISNGSIKLDGHESADVRLVPKQAGTFKVRCTHFMHSGFGMKGTITVR
jgi:uncharacterized cupredoxin-like copper-binding protein